MGRPLKGDDKLSLSLLQKQFINAYFDCDESPTRIAQAMGWADRGRVSSMLKSEKVQIEIARRKRQIHLFRAVSDQFGISRQQKMELLWEIALAGAERGIDREGNRIMVNPHAAIAAIKEMNIMAGDHAPEKQELFVTHDERPVAEIQAHIVELKNEFDQLMDGEEK